MTHLDYRPADWLVRLTRLSPKASWPWRHACRLAIAITLPMLVGLWMGRIEASMLICLGALLNSVKVQSTPYRSRFGAFLIIVPMAVTGFLLGELVAGHGLATLVFLVLMALVSGVVSGYGAVFSNGAMQMLVLAVIAGSGHIPGPIWLPPLLYAAGAALAALLLAIAALFDRHLPERRALAALLHALSHLARIAADPQEEDRQDLTTPIERQRRRVTDAMQGAYSDLLATRLSTEGRTSDSERRAALLATIDGIFSAVMAGAFAPDRLRALGTQLDTIATAVSKGRQRPDFSVARDDEITELLTEIWPAAASRTPGEGLIGAGRAVPGTKPAIASRLSHLVPGREVMFAACKLALCMAIAFVAQSLFGGLRSYWIPLCVVIVMKPDFGSVFARAVQRSLGTILGVAVGIVVLALVPKGGWLILCVGVLGFLLPGAGQRGYAIQCALLTPLILILIEFTDPGMTVDFGPERLVDTLIGSAIVLVFGYLIWPRNPAPQIHAAFSKAMTATIALLNAATKPGPGGAGLSKATIAAYQSLSNVRTTLQRALAEPPPANREAAAWYPVVVEMERLCDRLTALGHLGKAGRVEIAPADAAKRASMLAQLAGGSVAEPKGPSDMPQTVSAGDGPFRDVDLELARLRQMLARGGGAVPAVAPS
jgi:uncharacterized membrane protein YccC